MNRREFMKIATLAPMAYLAPWVRADEANDLFWSLPRELWLIRRSTGEEVREVYWHQGAIYRPGYERICTVLRDVKANARCAIDVRLLDLMRAQQGWLDAFGYRKPMLINSGYRTAKTNNSLEGAVKNSHHLKGEAVDYFIEGLPMDYQQKLASYYQAGGVGIYVNKHFIHTDVGRVRHWRG